MTIDWKALAAPFPPDAVSWRVGSVTRDKTRGMALAFLDARDVMNRLDDVLGPAGWQCRYSHADDKKTVCDIAVKVDGEWVWKADGAGETDIEAEKGSLSSAFKRAAVRWGIGRYLYDLPSPWVELKDGKFIPEHEMPKLRALLAKDARQATGPSAPPPASKAPPPPSPSGKGNLFWIEADGSEVRFEKGSDWFAHALKKLRSARDPAPLWAVNGKTANEIVERAPDHLKGKAEELRDQCIRAVDDARDLTAAA